MKEIYIAGLSAEEWLGEEVELPVLLKSAKAASNPGGTWANLVLFDRTGEIGATVFGEDALKAVGLEGTVVIVRGMVVLYNSERRLKVRSVSEAGCDDIDYRDYVPCLSDEAAADLTERLNGLIRSVGDENLNLLLRSVFQTAYLDKFRSLPGGYMHHAFAGGLLAHTVEVAEAAALFAEQDRGMFYSVKEKTDRNLIVAGALLHDIGKCLEYKEFPFMEKSEDSVMCGYKLQGVRILDNVIKTIIRKYPDSRSVWNAYTPILMNMVYTCHKTNAEPPRTKEARLVMLADTVSADRDAFDYALAMNHDGGGDDRAVYSRYFGCKISRKEE